MISVQVLHDRIFNYIAYINKSEFINEFKIKNTSESNLENIIVEISFRDELASNWVSQKISIEEGKQVSLDFERQKIQFDNRKLRSMTESYIDSFNVKITHEEEVIFTQDYEFELLAYNQWLGVNYQPKLIASLVVPNNPKLIPIVKDASEILKGWDQAFTAYQTDMKTDVKAQVKALYIALQKQGISYISAPPSFEESGQRVRLPNEVLDQKLGNCIELALLFASLLEYVGINPLIVIIEGHAFVGAWLCNQTSPEAANDDISYIKKRTAQGIEQIVLIETTNLTSSSEIKLEDAIEAANRNLDNEDKFIYMLDIKKTRLLGVKVLPQENETIDFHASDVDKELVISDIEMPEEIENLEEVEIVTRRKRTRLKTWESKLLNLKLSNNLLNFRPTKRSIPVMEGDLDFLEDRLSSNEEFALVPCPVEMDGENRAEKIYSYTSLPKSAYQEYMNVELRSNRLVTLMDDRDLDYAIKALYYTSRTELEENGANTLYLAIGFLKWFETDISKRAYYAPILLYPIEMIRKSSVKGYVIRFRDEEPQLNLTLLEKLRMELNIEIPSLDVLPIDESGIDVKQVLNIFRSAIADKPNWDVVDHSYISLFTFSEFVMWNDLHSRGEEVIENPLITSLVEGSFTNDGHSMISPNEVDTCELENSAAILMDADSSQLAAIYSSVNGNSFVLHGPPGTGKSQTITNIIASALYQGKSVLFVAEKMAALNVVQERLKKVGLENFALELHSNKSRKSTILERFGETLDLQQNGKIKDLQKQRSILEEEKNSLRSVNEELHRISENGFSIYDLISVYEKTSDCERLRVSEKAVSKVSVDYFREIEMKCEGYALAYSKLDKVLNHPLERIQLTSLSMKERNSLQNDIEDIKKQLQSIIENPVADRMLVWMSSTTLDAVQQVAILENKLINYDQLFKQPIIEYNTDQIDSVIENIVEIGLRTEEIYNKITLDYDETIFDFDATTTILEWRQSEEKWFLPKMLNQNAILKKMRLYSKNPKALTKERVIDLLNLLKEYKNNWVEIEQYMAIHQSKYLELWIGKSTNWSSFSKTLNDTKDVIEKVRSMEQETTSIDINRMVSDIFGALPSYANDKDNLGLFVNELEELINKANEVGELIHSDIIVSSEKIETEISVLEEMLKYYNQIDYWVDYFDKKTWFVQEELDNFISQVELDSTLVSQLSNRIKHSLSYNRIIEELDESANLRNFKSSDLEVIMDKYKKDIELTRKMTELDLLEKLVKEVPSTSLNVNVNSELGIMKKAVKNGGRGISLRKVFDSTPNIIRKIAPCMLMSPMSIAQYIDPSFPKFDLVIFDEASQVYTHTAVGAISRGNQLIVVGDPKQLPPTSFFKGNYEDDEEEFEDIDQDSILDECQTVSMPELYLNWHYRSRHESLIAFSNSQYYSNKLFTFPSVNDQISKVKLVKVNGYYDRGLSKENEAEADEIVKEVKRRLSNAELCKHSIGIVTFSSIQQRLIQNKLDEMFMKNPKLEEVANKMKEPIFIKNLENVQGDERDIILFSIGYGPDKGGKVTMNFGPLNQEGGWKRLNVVVSRSREEMIIYSVLQPEDIDLTRTSSKGVYGLKRFLEFAKNKSGLSIDSSNALTIEDEVVNSVAQELRERGYDVDVNIGNSNFRVNVGIVDPRNSDSYLAAIIVDGKNSNMTPSIRDRHIVQPSMLEGLGWTIIHIWTLDWFKNKDFVLDDIFRELKELELLGDETTIAEEEIIEIEDEIEFIPVVEKEVNYYVRHELPTDAHNKEDIYSPQFENVIRIYMEDIIEKESPIVEEDLFRRILLPFGITQLGSRIRTVLENIASHCNSYKILDDDETVYWKNAEQASTYEAYRVPVEDASQEERRVFKFICDKEIENAIIATLENQVSLDLANLCKEVFILFGYQTLGDDAKQKVIGCVGALLYQDKIMEENERFLLNA